MKHLLILLSLTPALRMCPTPPRAGATGGGSAAWEIPAEGWRTDPAWYDGKAEKLTYRATRTIYGTVRHYPARAYTNKQFMNRETSTKSSGSGASDTVEVFKHHWSERIETEAYDYDFSTAAFVSTADLALFKLTAGTQEDCGSSFKQFWRDGGDLAYFESVYFPDAGVRQGRLRDPDVMFEDALPLVLRDFPFGSTESIRIRLVRSQKSTKQVPFDPVVRVLEPRGEEPLALPIGRVAAQRLDLVVPDSNEVEASYWFASDGSAPMLHALLRYEGPGGVTYQLESHERTAYWER